jgi:hypothetical protein
MDMKDGHIRPLPTTNGITAPPTETILFDTNKIKFVPKIKLPTITNFSSEIFFALTFIKGSEPMCNSFIQSTFLKSTSLILALLRIDIPR